MYGRSQVWPEPLTARAVAAVQAARSCRCHNQLFRVQPLVALRTPADKHLWKQLYSGTYGTIDQTLVTFVSKCGEPDSALTDTAKMYTFTDIWEDDFYMVSQKCSSMKWYGPVFLALKTWLVVDESIVKHANKRHRKVPVRIKCENMVIKLGATLNMKMPSYVEYSDNLVELFMLYHAIPCYAMIQHEKNISEILCSMAYKEFCLALQPCQWTSTPLQDYEKNFDSFCFN